MLGRRVLDEKLDDEGEENELQMVSVKDFDIKMNFTLPEYISQGLKDKDKIVVEILPAIFNPMFGD